MTSELYNTLGLGVVGDAGFVYGVGASLEFVFSPEEMGLCLAERMAWKDMDLRLAGSVGESVGTAAGTSANLQIAYWWPTLKKLRGDYIAVDIGVALEGGLEVSLVFSRKLEFLGFAMRPSVGVEVELAFNWGKTQTWKI